MNGKEVVLYDRTKVIGGSDIAAVMGLSRWSSPLQTWAIKTGKVEAPDLSDVEHVQIGTELEEYVARKFAQKTGFKIRRDKRTFKHPKYPYMVAHIDRWILGEDALFEAKTTSAWKEKEWRGEEMPREYIMQVVWYLGVLGKKVGYVACLIGGQRFAWKKIEFDAALFERMVEAAKLFWEVNVLGGVQPLAGPDDGEVLDQLFPVETEAELRFDGDAATDINNLVDELKEGSKQKKTVEENIDAARNRLHQYLGEAKTGITGQYYITLKSQRVAPFLDTDALKNDGLYEKYQLNNQTRVLRYKDLNSIVKAKNKKGAK